jgi:16S rRNA processing protein RimM
MENLIGLGVCRKAHGIKGAANFYNQHVLGSDLSKGDQVFLFPENENSSLPKTGQLFTIRKITYGHKIMIEVDGIHNRNELDAILPFEIKIERPDLPEGEYLIEDLIGFSVHCSQSKNAVGVIEGVYDNGVQQVLEVRGEVEIDLPFVENFFPHVSLEKKEIMMVVPEIIEEEK